MTAAESQQPTPEIEVKESHPYVTRSIARLYNEGVLTNVSSIDVEPEYGYTTRIGYNDGSFRITYGNDLGLNAGASCDLAKDKGHSKFILKSMGVNVPEGQEFLLPWWADSIRENQAKRGNTVLRTTDEMGVYLDQMIGYPAYLKPVSGSKGSGVHRVDKEGDVTAVLDEYSEKQVRVAVAERAVDMPDYRIVMLDGELISAYERSPLQVTGDGEKTVSELLDDVQQLYFEQGRDTKIDKDDQRIKRQLGKSCLTMGDIVPPLLTVQLHAISNLSAGGTSTDITAMLHERWSELSARIAHNFNLRLCGVDLACEDIAGGKGDYSVLEVNAAPGLDHYASSGDEQSKIVDALYARVINTSA